MPLRYLYRMSKAEILCEIPKLTPEERDEIRQKLDELDGGQWIDSDDPLTEEDKALLEARLGDMEQHPEKSIPWEEAEARLVARFGE
jgi:putative addiction module component (TIGR02574 family)